MIPASSAAHDPRAGRAMQAIAVFGVLVTVAMVAVVWQVLADLDRNLDRSLAIGEDAAATLTETIDVADELIVAVDDGLSTIDATLDTLATTSDQTADVAEATAQLATSLPDTFGDVDAALAVVESLGGTIDGALRTASRLPLGPDYDPDVAFPDAIAGLRDALAPLADELDSIAVELEEFGGGSGAIGADLADVRADVERTRAALAQSATVLDRYRDTATRAELLATTTRADAGRSLEIARWMLLPVALLMLVSQYVPWWLGRRLTRESADDTGPSEGVDEIDEDDAVPRFGAGRRQPATDERGAVGGSRA